ncbi:MAG: BamA/TamA family outer membrane protein [Chitinispirillia bacterium]|nr:BamA/TamA family outer membrane protein [Chitinispirillia bacterium]MCL2269520.1 BamA/TamA family outer membrane protein [Chitinispirillia bacterium]
MHHLRLILTLYFLICTLASANPDTAATVYISGIEIYGNVTTRPEVIRHFITFDKGEPLDTSKLRETRENFLATRLYDKVDIFPHMREDGAHVFIVLKESVRLNLGYGGVYSTRKHGQKVLWYSFHFDVGLDNFRGRLEEFWFGAGAWDRRSLDLSWYKPFLATPYYISVAAGTSAYPDHILPLDYLDVYARLTAGMKFGEHSRLALSAIPVYRNRDIIEAALDSSVTIPLSFKSDIFEAFAALAYSIDIRDARFDPRRGWYYAAQLRTNRLYNDVNIPYFQLSNEFRSYWSPGGGDMASLRLMLTLRDRDAGSYHRLTYGGAGEIRGYSDDALGWQFVANSSLLASLKYHKLLYKTPQMPFPIVGMLFSGVNRITFKFDATFIADYARLARGPAGILTFDDTWQDGVGIGIGTRIIVPEIRQSACIDLVFGRIDDADGSRWEPALHLYLDLFF